jgi:hypothetical protein
MIASLLLVLPVAPFCPGTLWASRRYLNSLKQIYNKLEDLLEAAP